MGTAAAAAAVGSVLLGRLGAHTGSRAGDSGESWERGRRWNSKQEVTAGRGRVTSWGPDTHSVRSRGRGHVCTCVGGCVCVKQISGK